MNLRSLLVLQCPSPPPRPRRDRVSPPRLACDRRQRQPSCTTAPGTGDGAQAWPPPSSTPTPPPRWRRAVSVPMTVDRDGDAARGRCPTLRAARVTIRTSGTATRRRHRRRRDPPGDADHPATPRSRSRAGNDDHAWSAAGRLDPSPAGGGRLTTIELGGGQLHGAPSTATTWPATPCHPRLTFTCIAPGLGQNLHVDTRHRRTHADDHDAHRQPSPVEYGAAPDVTADVATTGSNAKPAGTVEFTFEGKTVKVDGQGRQGQGHARPGADDGFPHRHGEVHADRHEPGRPARRARPSPWCADQTTTTATAVYRDARNRLVGKALVEAQNGTDGRRRRQARAEAQRRQDPYRGHRAQHARQGQEGVQADQQARHLHSWSPATSAPTRSSGPSTGSKLNV